MSPYLHDRMPGMYKIKWASACRRKREEGTESKWEGKFRNEGSPSYYWWVSRLKVFGKWASIQSERHEFIRECDHQSSSEQNARRRHCTDLTRYQSVFSVSLDNPWGVVPFRQNPRKHKIFLSDTYDPNNVSLFYPFHGDVLWCNYNRHRTLGVQTVILEWSVVLGTTCRKM